MPDYDVQKELEEVKKEVAELRGDVRELLNLWQQSRGILNFLKFVAYAAGALTGFIVFIKPYLK